MISVFKISLFHFWNVYEICLYNMNSDTQLNKNKQTYKS